MDVNKFYEELEKKAKDKGISEIEIYYQKKKEFNCKVFRGKVEKYQISEESGLSIRGMYNKRIGYYYTELLDTSFISEIVNSIIESSKNIEVLDEEITGEKITLINNDDYDLNLKAIDREDIIKKMIDAETELLSESNYIVDAPYNMFADIEYENILINSKGLKLNQKSNLYYCVLSALAKKEEQSKTSVNIFVNRNLDILDYKPIIKTVAKESIDLLSASSVESGIYDVVFRNDVASEILNSFYQIFSGEMRIKGLSLLDGKLGEKIGSDVLSIIDDPFNKEAIIKRTFDDEGTMTTKKTLVEDGIFKSFLHNKKTAKKTGEKNTGNGYRSSYKSTIDVSSTNLFIERGNSKLDEVIGSIEEGILIIDVQALHSGLSVISGDFSLPAQGYYIKNGVINRSVDSITVSGNILDLFANTVNICEDLKFYLPNGMGSVGSPSIHVKGINISGK